VARAVVPALKRAVMGIFLLSTLTATFLAAVVRAQENESTPPTVVDAARAARERQKSIKPKAAMTEDGSGSYTAATKPEDFGALEAKLRKEMESSYPPKPTATLLAGNIREMKQMANYPGNGLLARFKYVALVTYETVEFPGKKEWEQDIAAAVENLIVASAKGAVNLQAILDENRDALANGDASTLARIREMWIDARVPSESWLKRVWTVTENGQTRAKAFATGNPVGMHQYRSGDAKRTEPWVGSKMATVQKQEAAYKRAHGRYSCDVGDFANDPENPKVPNWEWNSDIEALGHWGYRLDYQNCDASHFTAVAVPPAADGSEGRAFCTNESGVVRMASDGSATECILRGSVWDLQ
jgi:hypothetical protein